MAPFLVLSILGYQRAKETIESRQLRAFETLAERRHAQIDYEIEIRKQFLDAVVAFFAASREVDHAEFRSFASSLLRTDSITGLCWTSTNGDVRFRSDSDASVDTCAAFDINEPSRVLEAGTARIMLSKPASSRASGQTGFVTIIFEAQALLRRETTALLSDYLVVVEPDVRASTWRLSDDGVRLLAGPAGSRGLGGPGPPEANRRTFDLDLLGSARVLYVVSRRRQADLSELGALIFFLVLAALGVLAATYVRALIRTKERITKEVTRRTEELSQFAYRSSHDLRGPLVTVGGLCRAALEDLADGKHGDVQVNIERISKHVGRLDKLVGDILELARADVALHDLEPIDFTKLCDEAIAHVSETLSGHQVEIRYKVDVARQHYLPKGRLVQVFENLISNSVKYANRSRETPWVVVEVRDTTASLQLTFKDNGLGIPADRQDRLFRMFERFHRGASLTGSGLGMSIVKKHIDTLQGKIDVSSDEQGTMITIRLPSEGQPIQGDKKA